jgi:mevalonate kinase
LAHKFQELETHSGAEEDLTALKRKMGMLPPEEAPQVRAETPKSGLFGAKITGGGSGGTVAIFGTVDAETKVREIAARYEEWESRIHPDDFAPTLAKAQSGKHF